MTTKQRLKNRGAVSSGNKEEMPVIKWDEMSIMDVLELAEKQDEESEQNVISAKIMSGFATEEDFKRLEHLRSREVVVEFINYKAEAMAKYVSDVPRSWFKKSAPETLDFSDPETFKLLQPKRFIALFQLLLMSNAQADAASGN